MYKRSYNSCCNRLETPTRRSFSSVPLKFNWPLGVVFLPYKLAQD
jgi:hypothetical protein